MDDMFVKGIIICCVYLIFRFMEMRFFTKERIPLKKLVRDALLVYISFLGGMFIYTQLEPIKELSNNAPVVFTNNPEF